MEIIGSRKGRSAGRGGRKDHRHPPSPAPRNSAVAFLLFFSSKKIGRKNFP